MRFRAVAGVVCLSVTLVAGLWLRQQWQLDTASNTLLVSSVAVAPTRPVSVVVVQQDTETARILFCARQRCAPQVVPASVDAAAVTDGQNWYVYADIRDEKTSKPKRVLQRLSPEGTKPEIIVESTPLVVPRDLIISPDGQKIAYWLDNSDQPQKKLTELWLYDRQVHSTRLLAENVHQDAVLTRPRWNRASTHVWYVHEGGLQVVQISPVASELRFNTQDWQELLATARDGVMDLRSDGRELAYALETKVVVAQDDGPQTNYDVAGQAVFLKWLEPGRVLYGAQRAADFIIGEIKNEEATEMIVQTGTVQAMQMDSRSEVVVFVVQTVAGTNLYSFDLQTRQMTDEGGLVPFGTKTFIVSAKPGESAASEVAGVKTSQLSDGELITFIDTQLGDITGVAPVKASRILITDQTNSVYIDYAKPAGDSERLLLTVQDALPPRWSIRARYSESAGEWHKTIGGGTEDPHVVRWYEWEEAPKQWILKSGS